MQRVGPPSIVEQARSKFFTNEIYNNFTNGYLNDSAVKLHDALDCHPAVHHTRATGEVGEMNDEDLVAALLAGGWTPPNS